LRPGEAKRARWGIERAREGVNIIKRHEGKPVISNYPRNFSVENGLDSLEQRNPGGIGFYHLSRQPLPEPFLLVHENLNGVLKAFFTIEAPKWRRVINGFSYCVDAVGHV
jgi:hypothetical protein